MRFILTLYPPGLFINNKNEKHTITSKKIMLIIILIMKTLIIIKVITINKIMKIIYNIKRAKFLRPSVRPCHNHSVIEDRKKSIRKCE